jgi:leucyl/phenylalanyl-tRNA--protein transferase
VGVEPMPTGWEFPDPATAHPSGVVAVGADLEPGTLLAAYRRGMFPMPEDVPGGLVWWSPDPRGVIEPGCFHASRSLHRARRRFEVHVDTRFAEVVAGCAAVPRPGAWISPEVTDAYTRLHELGWAHSIEVLDDAGRLVGGVYGVGIGGFFAGESMFHLQRDASKVALWALCELLDEGGGTLVDVQWTTDHLRSLGAVDVPRVAFLERLAEAIALPVDPFAAH